MAFANAGGIAEAGTSLVEHSRLGQECAIAYPPFRTRVLAMMHDMRREEGWPRVQERSTAHTGRRAQAGVARRAVRG